MAKKDGKRVSDLVNLALKEFLDGANAANNSNDSKKHGNPINNERFVLRNDGEIKLSKRDILGLKKEVGRFLIENKGRMIFEKNTDKDSLKHIESIIIHSGTVEVPRALYPLFLLISEIHGKLEKY